MVGTIDAIQFFADLFLTEFAGIPEIVSEFADPFIGILLCIYFELRGVQIIKQPKRLFSLLGITGMEELTGGLAPAWTLDVWYIYRSVKNDEAIQKAQRETKAMGGAMVKALNQEGRREAMAAARRPLNEGGVRQPQRE